MTYTFWAGHFDGTWDDETVPSLRGFEFHEGSTYVLTCELTWCDCGKSYEYVVVRREPAHVYFKLASATAAAHYTHARAGA